MVPHAPIPGVHISVIFAEMGFSVGEMGSLGGMLHFWMVFGLVDTYGEKPIYFESRFRVHIPQIPGIHSSVISI